jgi:antirestriction protein ArdC
MAVTTHTNQTVYDSITANIIEALEQGVAPWVRPWAVSLPRNAVSGREYNGVNILSCLAHQLHHGHQCSAFVTFQQAKSLGGWVRQGECGVLLLLYREIERPSDPEAEQEERHSRRLFLAKGFTVFNLEQTGGLAHVRERFDRQCPGSFEPLEECERIIRQTGAVIHEGVQASYSPNQDLITMPPRHTFHSAAGWYGTLFHETVHWTGAPRRLNRQLGAVFGSQTYAREELVAELGACFLSARCGIEHVSRSASYIGMWLEALQNDKRFIFTMLSTLVKRRTTSIR